MRLAVIVNPVGSPETVEELRKVFDRRSLEPAWFETTEADPGAGQVAEALEERPDVVVACGGDGTVRACADALAGGDVPLAVIPAGTGNLLARNFAIPTDVDAAVEIALGIVRHRLDLGIVNGERFAVMAGAGLDAIVMDETTREAKSRLGAVAYVLEGLRHLGDGSTAADLTVDAGERRHGVWATTLVGNLGHLQGGVDLFPDSSPDDGYLDLLGLASETAGETVSAGVAAAVGADSDHLVRRRFKRLTVDFDEPTPYEIDGEPRGEVTRLEFTVDPGAIEVCCPEESRS